MSRWFCTGCSKVCEQSEVLEAPNPFCNTAKIFGCPSCKAVESLVVANSKNGNLNAKQALEALDRLTACINSGLARGQAVQDIRRYIEQQSENDRDAARYRWLRDGEISAEYPYPVMRMSGSGGWSDRPIWEEELDAAIDAAMAKEPNHD